MSMATKYDKVSNKQIVTPVTSEETLIAECDIAPVKTRLAQSKKISLRRQSQLAMTVLLLLCGALAEFVNPAFWALAAGIGCGVIITRLSGYCLLNSTLERMPWNRSSLVKLRC